MKHPWHMTCLTAVSIIHLSTGLHVSVLVKRQIATGSGWSLDARAGTAVSLKGVI